MRSLIKMNEETILAILLAITTAISTFGLIALVYKCCSRCRSKRSSVDHDQRALERFTTAQSGTSSSSPAKQRTDVKQLNKHSVAASTQSSTGRLNLQSIG